MREILFRGKCPADGRWYEGNLGIEIAGNVVIEWYDREHYERIWPDPDTLGMCSYLPDDSGHIMYEGDIVCVSNQTSIVGVVCFGITTEVNGVLYKGFFVEWKGEHRKTLRNSLAYWADTDNITVIGNIHDDPELMGGENDG